jgi:fumarate reductase flavoprotein subunit
MVERWVSETLNTLGFLEAAKTGDAYNNGSAMGTATEPRGRTPRGGSALVTWLLDKATASGNPVTVMTNVKATELKKNSAGQVVQVIAEGSKSKYIFNVRKAVVIATGGFDSDHGDLLATHNPNSKDDIPASSHGNIGEGIKMATTIGAATVFKGGKIGWNTVDKGLPGTTVMSGVNSSRKPTIVDNTGTQIPVDPPSGVTYTGNPDYPPLHSALLRARDAGKKQPFYTLGTGNPSAAYQQLGVAKTVLRDSANGESVADALIRLAKEMGASDAEAATVGANLLASYTDIGTNVTTGTRYTVTTVVPSSIGSMGGLKINGDAQVLDTSGNAIPGLYAAGETANGQFFGKEYPASGSSLSICVTFGRIAGAKAAAESVKTLLE